MTRDMDPHPTVGPDDLIAYLDGEVDVQTREKFERCLAQDPQLLQRMREHQQAWDLLDELPRDAVGDDFARTTLQMVAVAAADDVEQQAVAARMRRGWLRVAGGASLIAASLVGFVMTLSSLDRPNRELLQDLPVIENLEAFQQVENVEFLLALENEGLFVAEVDDER